MRTVGVVLVILTLAFGAGGVARRPLADTGPGEVAPAAPPAQNDADAGGSCSAPAPPVSVQIDLSKSPAPKDFISLNGRGYNYRQPGEPPQIIPDSTGKQKPEGVK